MPSLVSAIPPGSPRAGAGSPAGSLRELLRQRVVTGLHLGLLAPGDRLPSARATADELGLDLRRVVAAYRELEAAGLVEVRPRSGIFVADSGGAPQLSRLGRRVVDVLVDEVVAGTPAPDFPELVRRCLETLRLHAVCVECNDDQVVGMERELERDYGLVATGMKVAELPRTDEPLPAVLRRADLLVTTTFHAAEVARVAARLGIEHLVVRLDPGVRAELLRLLSEGPVYWVAVDPDFAEKLGHIFAGEPGIENLRTVVLGRDDPTAIPEDVPVLVMTAARERHPELAIVRRGQIPRGFSADSARQILAFVVDRNLAALEAAGLGGRPTRDPLPGKDQP